VGELVKVPYAPASALPDGGVSLVLATPLPQPISYTASAGELSFVVPDRVGPTNLTLLVAGNASPKPWPCEGAECRVVGESGSRVAVDIRPAM
jgi:hypothetical protein